MPLMMALTRVGGEGKGKGANECKRYGTGWLRFSADISLNEQYTTLAERYFQAQLAVRAAFLRSEALNAIEQVDHSAQRALDVGLISQVERLEAKQALANAAYENQKAINNANLAISALQRTLRTPYPIKPTTPLFVSSQPIADLSYFQNLAKTHHPGFDKVAAKYHQARALTQLNAASKQPNVALFARSQIETKPNWIAGISANWKLWGGIDNDAIDQANQAKMQQAKLSQVDANDNIMLLVEKNWQSLNNAQENYLALNANIELAQEMLRFRQLGFQEGVNTATDIIEAQVNLLKAKTEQAQAANDYVQALAALMESCGTPLAFNDFMQKADIKLSPIYLEILPQ